MVDVLYRTEEPSDVNFNGESHLQTEMNQKDDDSPDPVRQKLDEITATLLEEFQTARGAINRGDFQPIPQTEDTDSDASGEHGFYSGKSVRTVAAYRSRQLSFIKWARASIDCIYPEVVTSRRAVLYMTENLERLNSKNRINGPGMYDACASALSELMKIQRDKIKKYPALTDTSEPQLDDWPVVLRDIPVRSYIGTKKRFDIYVKNPQTYMIEDTINPAEYMTGLKKMSEAMLMKGQFAMHFTALGCHSLMIRADAMKNMELSGIIIGETNDGNKILYFETSDLSGRPQISASLRHKNPLFCSHLSLALLLFSRFHFRRNRKFEDPVDFSDSSFWHRIKVIRGLNPTSVFSFNRFEVKLRQEFIDTGVRYKNLPHHFQDCSARYCLENGVPTDSIRIFGHWDNNPDLQDPNQIVPTTPMHVLAGFKSDEPYNVTRNKLAPPQSVCEKIFPFINPYLKAINEDTLEEYIIAERRKKDEANNNNNMPNEERKPKKRKNKHYRPSPDELQKVIDIVLVFDYLRGVLVQDIPVVKQFIPTIRHKNMFQWNDFSRFSVLQIRHEKKENPDERMPESIDAALDKTLASISNLNNTILNIVDNFPSVEHLMSLGIEPDKDTKTGEETPEDKNEPPAAFEPNECLTIHEVYEDFKKMDAQREALVKRAKTLKEVKKHRSYQRRQNIYRLACRFVASGYELEEALDVLEDDFCSRNISINQYCDLKKDEVIKKFKLKQV